MDINSGDNSQSWRKFKTSYTVAVGPFHIPDSSRKQSSKQQGASLTSGVGDSTDDSAGPIARIAPRFRDAVRGIRFRTIDVRDNDFQSTAESRLQNLIQGPVLVCRDTYVAKNTWPWKHRPEFGGRRDDHPSDRVASYRAPRQCQAFARRVLFAGRWEWDSNPRGLSATCFPGRHIRPLCHPT